MAMQSSLNLYPNGRIYYNFNLGVAREVVERLYTPMISHGYIGARRTNDEKIIRNVLAQMPSEERLIVYENRLRGISGQNRRYVGAGRKIRSNVNRIKEIRNGKLEDIINFLPKEDISEILRIRRSAKKR